jgi:hypothetical protein
MSPTMNNLPESSSLHGNFTPLAILPICSIAPSESPGSGQTPTLLGESPISFQTRNAVVPLARRSR